MMGGRESKAGVRQSTLLRWPPYGLEIVKWPPFFVLAPARILWEGLEHSQDPRTAREARRIFERSTPAPRSREAASLAPGTELNAVAGQGSGQGGYGGQKLIFIEHLLA